MKIFKSSKSPFFIFLIRIVPYAIFSVLIIRLIIESFTTDFNDEEILVALFILSLIFVILIIFVERWMKMSYTIDNTYLIINAGVKERRINIKDIQSIKLSGYSSYGYKPALDFKGVQIIYELGRMIYVSPENREEFLEELKKVNEKIVVI